MTDEEKTPLEVPSENPLPPRKYGWKPDLPSHEDNFLMVAHPNTVARFPKFKFLGNLPPVYDQGNLGSCTSNALGGAFAYEQTAQKLDFFVPSRLFIYYNERDLEGTVNSDSGAMISDGIKCLTDLGVCPETMWPYDISNFTEKPSADSYKNAADHQVLASRRVPLHINGFKTMLNMGYPVVFGFTVFSYMESSEMASKGVLQMPQRRERPLGGHAVLCIGYSDTMVSSDGHTRGYLKIRNSWGESWGQQGNFWMPYDYVNAGLCSDAWVITKNENVMVSLNNELSGPNGHVHEEEKEE